MMQQMTEGVKNLILLNITVFIAKSMLDQYIPELSLYFPKSGEFSPYQLVTHFFMHANLQHLFFNMLMLYFLGPMVERALGMKDFLILYFLSALGAFIMHFAIDYYQYYKMIGEMEPTLVTTVLEEGRSVILSGKNYIDPNAAKLNRLLNVGLVGASGAIFGVVAAFGALFPNARLMLLFPPMPVKGKYLALLAIGMGIMFDFQGNVAHLAHIGGALIGFIFVRYFVQQRRV